MMQSVAYATPYGGNGTIIRYGGNTISEVDPSNGNETTVEQSGPGTSSYFSPTLDGQNYMSMFQQYDINGYNNSPLTISGFNGNTFVDFGKGFDNTYYNEMSPDGTKIAYFNVDDNYLSIFNLNTMSDERLNVPAYTRLVWSPDSTKIAFFYYDWSNMSSGTSAAIYNTITRTYMRINGLSAAPLDWSPTGRYVAYLDGKSVKAYDTTNGQISTMNPGNVFDGNVDITSFSWSPNGQQAVFVTVDYGIDQTLLHVSDGLETTSNVDSYLIDPQDISKKVKWNPSRDFFTVYRFYSPVVKRHLFTKDANEAYSIRANMQGVWNAETVAFKVKSAGSCSSGENVFRFYSELLKTHLYTMDEYEKSVLIGYNRPDIWRYEGIAYCANKNQQTVAERPVYRFYSELLKTHLYTQDENEKNVLIGYNQPDVWRFEGVAYYATPAY